MYTETDLALRKITMSDAANGNRFGDLICSLYFIGESAALLMDNKASTYTLLLGGNDNPREQSLLLTSKLVELLSYLQKLEDGKLIYVLEDRRDNIDLLSVKRTISKVGALEGQYELSDNSLLIQAGGSYKIFCEGKLLLCGNYEESSLYSKLSHYFFARLYPSPDLISYLDAGFKTSDERRAEEANKISKRSLILAWIVAIVSPFASLLLSNCFGIATLNESQFYILTTTIQHKKDTTANATDLLKLNTVRSKNKKDNK